MNQDTLLLAQADPIVQDLRMRALANLDHSPRLQRRETNRELGAEQLPTSHYTQAANTLKRWTAQFVRHTMFEIVQPWMTPPALV